MGDGHNAVVCVQCSFLYADISASRAYYDEYYAELFEYDDPFNSTCGGESDLDRERVNGSGDVLTPFFPSIDVRY